ncbi:unnamed protein product [Psylliodes chrysocephalus]|uniref:Uncharacterized protein n=1 Tax=Psylliodes chrysocephalus TaxID=3402493 RepID=A0A9P0GI89_9CUCU|nr:unnamed protein product [Psylliodes chrysocephala]
MFYFLATKLHKLYTQINTFSWNYSESGHGKGAPDGIGGATKQTADRLVAEGKDIASFDTLLESLKQNITNVTYFSIKKQNIENINTMIEKEKIKHFAESDVTNEQSEEEGDEDETDAVDEDDKDFSDESDKDFFLFI